MKIPKPDGKAKGILGSDSREEHEAKIRKAIKEGRVRQDKFGYWYTYEKEDDETYYEEGSDHSNCVKPPVIINKNESKNVKEKEEHRGWQRR